MRLNDYFFSSVNLDKLIVVGQCGAGVTASLSTVIDNRIDALILIDTPFNIVSGNMDITEAVRDSYSRLQMLKIYFSNLLKFRWLKRLKKEEADKKQMATLIREIDMLINIIRQKSVKAEISDRFNYPLARALMNFVENEKTVTVL